MAEQKRKIKPTQKRQLIEEAGGKCANPGCTYWRTHIHHIKHWAIYKCHNSADMIAICPSCHDAVHRGGLRITDDLLYLWKDIDRSALPNTTQIFVEPAKELKLLTGTIALSFENSEFVVFRLSNSNLLKLRVLDGDLLQFSSRLYNQSGKEILRVVENHVRVVPDKNVTFEYRPGRALITVPATNEYIPGWIITQMKLEFPNYGADGRVVALDLEVLKPGLLRVQGFWPSESSAIVITVNALCVCIFGSPSPRLHMGGGETSVINYRGPITGALFGLV